MPAYNLNTTCTEYTDMIIHHPPLRCVVFSNAKGSTKWISATQDLIGFEIYGPIVSI